MKLPILIVFILLNLTAFSQKAERQSYRENFVDENAEKLGIGTLDSTKQIKTYRIWYNGIRVVELMKSNDSTFDGHIVNYVTKNSGTKRKPKKELLILSASLIFGHLKVD